MGGFQDTQPYGHIKMCFFVKIRSDIPNTGYGLIQMQSPDQLSRFRRSSFAFRLYHAGKQSVGAKDES